MNDRKQEALELMKEYPEQTRGLSWQEVAMRWEEYSDSMAAGWLIPNTESVNGVFNFRESDSTNLGAWQYIAVKEDGVFGVKEWYGEEFGMTEDFITPQGETLDELVHDLEMMLEDLKRKPDR